MKTADQRLFGPFKQLVLAAMGLPIALQNVTTIERGGILDYVPAGHEHISLHRIWLFTTVQEDLKIDEQLHLLGCEECCNAFRACIGAESFGAVLIALGRGEGKLAS